MDFIVGLTTKGKADELRSHNYWIGNDPKSDVVENLYAARKSNLVTADRWNSYGDADKAWDEQNRKALGLDIAAIQNPLLNNNTLPTTMRENIPHLLGQKQCPCDTIDITLPKNCFETTAFALGLNFIGERELDGNDEEGALDDDYKLIDLLESSGYHKEMELCPFEKGPTEMHYGEPYENIVGLANLSSLKNLKPGDVLVFGAHDTYKQKEYVACIHASIYLGEYNGIHYVFEKPSIDCGPTSQYRIASLISYLEENIGYPSRNWDYAYDTVFVFRKKP